jgi:hypothetical protein
MKKLTIALAALLISAAAYGQGTIPVANQGNLTINNLVNSSQRLNRFYISGVDPSDASTSSVGTDYSVNFLGGPTGSQLSALVPLDPASSTFRGAAGSAGAGYFTGKTVTVSTVKAGDSADIVVRVLGPNNFQQDFRYNGIVLGGDNGSGAPPTTPPNLNFGTTPLALNTVPEPATLALGALGLGAALFFRRRQ